MSHGGGIPIVVPARCGRLVAAVFSAPAIRFSLVGFTGLVVNNLFLWLLVSGAGLTVLPASVAATQGAIAWNFSLTERWVFTGGSADRIGSRFARFAAVSNAVHLLGLPLLAILVAGGVHYLAANLVTTVVLFACRFAVSRRFIWSKPARMQAA